MSSLLFSPDDRMRTLMFLMLLDLHSCLPNLYLHKKTDLTGFVKIKPRHQDGLKKQIWVEKPSNGSPSVANSSHKKYTKSYLKIYQIYTKSISVTKRTLMLLFQAFFTFFSS